MVHFRTHAFARILSCSAAAAARASLWLVSELRSGLRKSATDELAGLGVGGLARGYRDVRVAGDGVVILTA